MWSSGALQKRAGALERCYPWTGPVDHYLKDEGSKASKAFKQDVIKTLFIDNRVTKLAHGTVNHS